jgi:hypothetical protein
VLIARDDFDGAFFINLLLTLLAWAPGAVHAMLVVLCFSKEPAPPAPDGYTGLPQTVPPSAPPLPHYAPPHYQQQQALQKWAPPVDISRGVANQPASGVQGTERALGYPVIDFKPSKADAV